MLLKNTRWGSRGPISSGRQKAKQLTWLPVKQNTVNPTLGHNGREEGASASSLASGGTRGLAAHC